MKVSLIAAVYKDIEALDLIVTALKTQTYKNFELVVAEDNDSAEMKAYVQSIEGIEVKHTFQEDDGIRKARSQNNGIHAATGEYLIFIDGDCVPYSTFIEAHVRLSADKTVLSGRRMNLGPKYSTKLRQKALSPLQLEKSFLLRFPWIAKDAVERHAEAGIYLDPDGWLFRTLRKSANTSLLGCNFSCFKKDFVTVNGFDEGYGATAISDDTDLEWRFKASGLQIRSCKNAANQFHLHHKRRSEEACTPPPEIWRKFLDNKAANRFVCDEGLNTHK